MDETYSDHGVQFSYPADWELSEEKRDDETEITVASPNTAFWSLTLFYDRPEPEYVMETVLNAFREEYPELDVYESKARVCGKKAVARDIEFVCWELLNSAWARTFRTAKFTALVLCQGNDKELQGTDDILARITQSLRCDGETEKEE